MTASKSLLLLYTSNLISQVVILIEEQPASRSRLALAILQLLMGFGSVIIILRMPMRNPALPKELISATFAPPTSKLRSPEDNLTLWQFMTVSWMKPLISVGKARQLNNEDVWELSYEFQHSLLHERFRELRGSVIRRLLEANVIDLVLLTVLGIVDLLASMYSISTRLIESLLSCGLDLSGPVLLQQLLQSIENPLAPRGAAVTYAVLSLIARLISSQLGVLSLWFGRRCYERSRGEMITMLYEKTLSRKIVTAHHDSNANGNTAESASILPQQPSHFLGNIREVAQSFYHRLTTLFKRGKAPVEFQAIPEAKEPASMGKILNLMRNDVYEVAQRFWEFQSLITKPLGLILSIILIWRLIGWPCLVGVLTVLVGQLVNAMIARVLLRWERIRRTATDRKLQKVSQFVEAIRHLRYYGWQDKWCEQIMEARAYELSIRIITGLWNILISFTNAIASGMFPVAAFYAYSALAGQPLRIGVAFPAIQVFRMLEMNLREIPGLITVLLNARVAVGRIEDFMSEPDKDENVRETSIQNGGKRSSTNGSGLREIQPLKDTLEDPANNGQITRAKGKETVPPTTNRIELKDASFSWPGSHDTVLRNLTLSFPPGLTVICGAVGAGKTALLQALLGELDRESGNLLRSDEMVGYCAQTPWLQSMTIRENILFSAPFEEARYKSVLEACALVTDMANFKHGDLSNIGENGVGLSGGQRARVALARAIYSRANILLLDDPISALDHQTAEFVIKNCLAGKLTEGRTTILVTHRTELCHGLAKQFVEVSNGTTTLLDLEKPFLNDLHKTVSSQSDQENADMTDEEETSGLLAEKFIEDEYRAHGGVKARVYWEYIKAGKLKWWFALICVLVLLRLSDIGQIWFLKQWGEAYNGPTQIIVAKGLFDGLPSPETNIYPWLVGFALIAIVKALLFSIIQSVTLIIVYLAGRQIFKDVMVHVSHATFRFYDVTPVGRLMNRLTSDINTIDGNISGQFQSAAFMGIAWATSIFVIASVTPIFLAFSLALTSAFVLIFLRFLPTSQSLRRLEMASLSPLMSNFGALLDGLTTVRAFCAQSRFQQRVVEVTDAFQKMDHFYWSLQAWLMYRFDVLSAFSTMLLTLIAIYTDISSGLTAFVLVAAADFVTSTHLLCKIYGQLQMDFVSVERVVELIHLDQELPGTIDPPAWWPTLDGDIVFDNATLRYAPQFDPSLSDLSLEIKAGSNTAIVGRTGSGKSTLAMALLATIVPEKGRILVDNIDIAAVDKQALRERITFVAQDPVLFPGSMRQNLDPMDEYSDEECEGVLEKICGRHLWTLTTYIEAGGRNLSQGQRQLIALARTLLKQSPIVILDEVCSLYCSYFAISYHTDIF
jgi:ABC-type multidrug transport system fused ATPase/permease subunit